MLVNSLINCAAFTGKDFEFVEEAHIAIEGGVIKEVGDGFESGGTDMRASIAAPSFVNGHTHLGDSFAKDAAADLGVDAAVGRDGVKWQLYQRSEREERVSAMRESLEFMLSSGTSCFADFREFGKKGVEELREAAKNIRIRKIIFGRDLPIEEVDGLGLNLYQTDQIPTDRAGRWVVLHAGEKPDEVAKALEYEPDVIVHATSASDDEIAELARKDIPVVVCPRANAALKVGIPPVRKLFEAGVRVCLGTDNVMLASPDMWRELEYVMRVCGLSAAEALRMATYNASEIFGLDCGCLEPGRKADIMFVNRNCYGLRYSRDLLCSLVSRCGRGDVAGILVNGEWAYSTRGLQRR